MEIIPELLSPRSGNSISAAELLMAVRVTSVGKKIAIWAFFTNFTKHRRIIWYARLGKSIMHLSESIKMRAISNVRFANL